MKLNYLANSKPNPNPKETIAERFNPSLGFGKYKPVAIQLLKKVTEILDEFEITYCIIAGTLLGQVRHNDFIPWDDDIDLLVDASILSKLGAIYQKWESHITVINRENFLIKICFKNAIFPIKNPDNNRFLLNPLDKYNWPFIDLFVYTYAKNDPTIIHFFARQWEAAQFFPTTPVEFVTLPRICIPHNPQYFLNLNYGSDYMRVIRSPKWNHKKEHEIPDEVVVLLK